MSAELFGFKYGWLEPSLVDDPLYKNPDQFEQVAQELAQIAIDNLPAGFSYQRNIIPLIDFQKINIRCFNPNQKKDTINKIAKGLDLLNQAIESRRNDPEGAWEEIILAANTLQQGIKDNIDDRLSEDSHKEASRIGGKNSVINRRAAIDKVSKAVVKFLSDTQYWDNTAEPLRKLDAVATAKNAIDESAKKGHDDWYGVQIQKTYIYYKVGKAAFEDGVDFSKRMFDKNRKY